MSAIKVFISSRMDGDFEQIRSEIEKRLKEYRIFDFYIFENEGARSADTETAYLSEINRADVVLILIDNQVGVRDGVRAEINLAMRLNKKQLYIFSSENCEEETFIEKHLKEIGPKKAPKFAPVKTNKEIIDVAVYSIVKDVIDEYTKTFSSDFYNSNDNEKSFTLESSSYKISKTTIKDFNIIKKLVYEYLNLNDNNDYDNTDFKNDEQKIITSLFNIVLGEEKYKQSKFEKLKDTILKYHDSKYHNIIEKRLLALNSYFMADFASAIDHLRTALNECNEEKNIPNWLKLDIAIDLRNCINRFSQLNNYSLSNNEGQSIINANNEPFHYPYLDREVSKIYREITKRYYENETQSPYSTTMRNHDFLLQSISNIFIISSINVSIANMELLRNHLLEFIRILNYETEANFNYSEMIKVLLLFQDDKELNKLIRRYNFENDIVTHEELIGIHSMLEKNNSDSEVLLRKFLLFKHFGYYFEDSFYKVFSSSLLYSFEEWINEEDRLFILGRLMIKALHHNIYRLSQNKIVDLILKCFNNDLIRWKEEMFALLTDVNYESVNEHLKDKVQKLITKSLKENEFKNSAHFKNLILSFSKQNSDLIEIENILSEKYKDFFTNEYNVLFKKGAIINAEKQVQLELDSLESSNSEQGEKGIYFDSISESNSLLKIKYLILHHDIPNHEILYNRVIDVIKKALINRYQSTDFKIRCLYFIIDTKSTDTLFRENFRNILRDYRDDILVSSGSSFFTNDSERLLKFVYGLTLSKINDDYDRILDMLLPSIEFDDYEKIQAFQALSLFLYHTSFEDMNDQVYSFIYHFSSINLSNNEEKVRLSAINCLISLYKFNTKEIGQKLLAVMNFSTSQVKSHLVSSLNNINTEKNETIEKIFEIAAKDNNYLVRYSLNNQ